MSNIKLGIPIIPLTANVITSSQTIDSSYNEYDYIYGVRAVKPRLASNNTAQTLTFDLGATTTLTADHLIIARADLLKSGGCTGITVDRSTDGSSWTTQHTVSSFSSYTLKGTQSDDLFDTFTESSAYRYWRVSLSGSSNKFTCSKISIGKLFDLGVDPDDFSIELEHKIAEANFMLGNSSKFRVDEARRKIKLNFNGVADSVVDSFFSLFEFSVVNYFPCFLVTTTNHEILENKYLIHCNIIDFNHRKVASNYNQVTIELLEDIG